MDVTFAAYAVLGFSVAYAVRAAFVIIPFVLAVLRASAVLLVMDGAVYRPPF